MNVGYAQVPPVKIEVTASKTEIKFDETVTITAKVTSELPGEEAEFFVMVSKHDRQLYEVEGNDRWHGILKPGESKTLTFKIKPKIPNDVIVVRVTNSFTGFDESGYAGSVIIKIKNAKAIRAKMKKQKGKIPKEGLILSPDEPISLPDSVVLEMSGGGKIYESPRLAWEKTSQNKRPFEKKTGSRSCAKREDK